MFKSETKRPIKRIGYSLLLLIALQCEISLPAQSITLPDEYALTGVLIYPAPGELPIHDGVVIVAHGKITAVGKKGEISIPPGYADHRLHRTNSGRRLLEHTCPFYGIQME